MGFLPSQERRHVRSNLNNFIRYSWEVASRTGGNQIPRMLPLSGRLCTSPVRWARVYRTANLYLPPAQLRGPAAYRETNTSLVVRLGRLRVLEALSNPGLGRLNRRLVVVVVSFTPLFI